MFSIEKATLADCPLIQTLASNIWEPTYGSILSREQLDYMFEMMYSNESLQKQMSELHHQFFIIYADGVPSGYLSIETVEKDLYTIELNVNRHNPAVGFYKHMGFHEHATRDFHIGNGYYMNDYIMRMEVKE